MGTKKFTVEDYFTPSLMETFPWKDIFVGIENIWEVLPKITPYIESCFTNGIVKGNYEDRKDVFVGEGTILAPGAYISGPALIGKNCVIGHASLLREGCILGDNSQIGHAVELKHSIMLNGSVLAHLNYVGDSIIGNAVNISGGTILANFRLDNEQVYIKFDNTKRETGLKKFGSIIGDNAKIGVNAVLNPGTILGQGSTVFPLTSVSGVYEKETIIK